MASEGKLPERLTWFFDWYRRTPSRAELQVEREVFGTNWGITSYTTPEQADLLAKVLELGPKTRVLDVGAGSGWPGLYLSERTGCRTVITDVPRPAVLDAQRRARKRGLRAACCFVVASGTHLPFRSGAFDVVLHSDVL